MLLERPLGPEHRQPQLQRAQLAPGEPHRPEEMVRDNGYGVALDEDLETLDEAARHLEPLGDGVEVPEQQRAIDADVPDQVLDQMGLPVRELRNEGKYPGELVGGGHRRAGGLADGP